MRREVKIGFFLGGTIFIVAVLLFIIGDLSTLFKKPGYLLSVSFDSASGLETRAAVRMAGVKIGYVKDIRLAGRKAQVVMSIFPRYQVPKGSKASLASLGLIGERYIEILPSEEAAFLQPNETMPVMPSVNLDQVGSVLLSVADDIKAVGQSVRELTGGESRASLQKILQNLDSFTRELDEFIGQNKGELETGIRSASQAAKGFDQRIKDVSRNIDETVGLLKDMAAENRETLKYNLEKIKELLSKIEESVRMLSESLEKINKGGGTLGKLIQDPKLYEEAESTLETVKRTVEPVSRLRATGNLRADYLGESQKWKSYLTLGFSMASRYFVLGQIVEDPFLKKFTYSAQGGVRWGALAPRGGVIESSFGAGVDVLTLGDRLVFSLEGFDFQREAGPHFRLAAFYSLLKYFHLLAGLDDFGQPDRREFYFGLSLGTR